MTDNMDIALSSRVRLARNIEGLPFTNRMTDIQKTALIDRVKSAAPEELMLIRMSELPVRERRMLVERHLISPNLAESDNAAALINREETKSILIGEEDHLRIQCIEPGLSLFSADKGCVGLDEALAKELTYCFDTEWGYLTACPTNLGSGMRASVMLHLPALSLMGQMDALILTVSKLGFTVRGFYGEGSGAPGHVYQLSNQITLGVPEEEILNTLNETVRSVIERERASAIPLFAKNRLDMEDRVFRSLGALLFAHKLKQAEAVEYISNIKLGASIGLLPAEAHTVCNRLITEIQSASVAQRAGGELTPSERHEARAKYVRGEIAQIESMYKNMQKRGDG